MLPDKNKLTVSAFQRTSRLNTGSRSGVALVITLIVLALMTIIAVGFLGSMTFQAQTTRRNFESQKARAFVTLGLNSAVAQLRSALGPWDAPYGNEAKNFVQNYSGAAGTAGFLTNSPTNYWSVSPGIISIWSYTATTPVTNYPLFSLPKDGSANLANLNAQDENGVYPVLGITNSLPVYWVDVLSYPTAAAASTNTIIGRYAFWVDDENSKININTADGVLNTNQPSGTTPGTYMGAGTPTEVSLMELSNSASSGSMSATWASNVVAYARVNGFNSPKEILRYASTASGSAYDLYTNNIFNLTVASRSPDLNVFGQPKMPLIPANASPFPYQLNSVGIADSEFQWNMATLQPLKELFPSQTGSTGTGFSGVLPAITLTDFYSTITSATTGPNTFTTTTISSVKWPLAFTLPLCTSMNPSLPSTGDNNSWDNGQVIASYLAGTNAMGKPITWPRFPGTTTTATSYLGKYTARQIDSITLQILDLATKDTSPDIGQNQGPFVHSSDSAFRGWLSGRLVNGVGRNPKLDKVLMKFTVEKAKTFNPNSGGGPFYPPDIQAALYMELWVPSRFSGISLFHNENDASQFYFGTPQYGQSGMMNCQDFGTNAGGNMGPGYLPRIPTNSWLPSYMNGNVGWVTNTSSPYGYTNELLPSTPDGSSTSYSYWQNNLLRVVDQNGNCAGVDWAGNSSSIADPQKYMATRYHAYEGTNTAGLVKGSGPGGSYPQMFSMNPMTYQSSSGNINDWAPGEYRCISNRSPSNQYPLATSATSVAIQGGIAYLAIMNNTRQTDPSDVPLDAMRGTVWPTGSVNTSAPSRIATPSGERIYNTLAPYTNILNAVIPINTPNITVPAYGSSGNTVWVYGSVYDPLVSKFPADWNMTNTGVNGACPAPSSMQYGNASTVNPDNSICATYPESSSTLTSFSGATNGWYDPDSYWLPTIDNNAGMEMNVVDAPQIPRTARFPSIGYLQYVRTGIMPDWDDLTYSGGTGVPYLSQIGIPFRLLNFNQINDASQTVHGITYPDWAMLDLFYVPSSLLGYGSPYETFAGGRTVTTVSTQGGGDVWSANFPVYVTYANTNAVNNMYLYGTYGGATSGRINPNGAVLYSTNVNVPTPGITRTVPLQALLHGLMVNQTQTGQSGVLTNNLTGPFPAEYTVPLTTAGTAVSETSIAQAIVSYLQSNPVTGSPMPMRMPEEIANVGAIAALKPASPIVNPTRNDLVRQIVGNLTTQSNTFSVWVEGQSIQKSRANLVADSGTPANFGLYQSGDQITGTVRYHFIVERDLDAGNDGVYGNTASPGPDGIVGTLDDTMTTGPNPSRPDYNYRVIYAEEIR